MIFFMIVRIIKVCVSILCFYIYITFCCCCVGVQTFYPFPHNRIGLAALETCFLPAVVPSLFRPVTTAHTCSCGAFFFCQFHFFILLYI